MTFASVTEPEQLGARQEAADYRLAAAGREAAEDERLDLLETPPAGLDEGPSSA